MIHLEDLKHFSPWTHPKTGVTGYLLTHKVAPLQEAFHLLIWPSPEHRI
jgi:hypothetical protein